MIGAPNQNCLELRGVCKNYGKVMALKDLSFEIPWGEKYALLGPNGAGKSTTLRLLIGLLKPDSGEITVGGSEPGSSDANHYPELSF